MGKAKSTTVNIHNEVAPSETSNMLTLREIVLPDVYDQKLPEVSHRDILVRAEAIDLVEPDSYPAAYLFRQEDPQRWMYSFVQHRFWWADPLESNQKPCVKIHIAGQDEKLVEGTVEHLKEIIDAAELS